MKDPSRVPTLLNLIEKGAALPDLSSSSSSSRSHAAHASSSSSSETDSGDGTEGDDDHRRQDDEDDEDNDQKRRRRGKTVTKAGKAKLEQDEGTLRRETSLCFCVALLFLCFLFRRFFSFSLTVLALVPLCPLRVCC